MGCPTVRGCIVRYPYVSPPYYGALFVGDGVSLPIPPQFGCDECILTHITLYLNQKGGKSRAKLVGSSWYLTPLLWDTPGGRGRGPRGFAPRLGNRVQDGRTPTSPGGGRVRSPLCGSPLGKFQRRQALFLNRRRTGGVVIYGSYTRFLGRTIAKYYGDRTCSARRPAQANWWCPTKKDTTPVAYCSAVGESRLKPPPSAAGCCVVGELRLKPPPP